MAKHMSISICRVVLHDLESGLGTVLFLSNLHFFWVILKSYFKH